MGWRIATAWDLQPSVIVAVALSLIGYLALRRGRFDRRTTLFLGGLAVAGATVLSPLDTLGDTYLFSAHMLEHLILLLAVPPLLLAGLPPAFDDGVESLAPLRPLLRPVVTLPIAAALVWMWHLPALFEAALGSEPLHALEHASFVLAGTALSWPLLRPARDRRIPSAGAMVYVAGGMVVFALLGILITLSGPGLYPSYVHPEDPLGVLSYLRSDLGLTVAFDQQAAGIEMWLGGIPVLLGMVSVHLQRLFREESADEPLPADPWRAAKPVRIPRPTVWPPVVAAGATGLALGALTSAVVAAAGGAALCLGMGGWIHEMLEETKEDDDG